MSIYICTRCGKRFTSEVAGHTPALCSSCEQLLALSVHGSSVATHVLPPATVNEEIPAVPQAWEADLPSSQPPSHEETLVMETERPLRGPGQLEIPGYEILGELGRGGMGIVTRARQQSLGRLVALKMIRAGSSATSEELARFRREAEAVARLQHPHIVQIYTVGEVDGCPFLELELCPGGTLAQLLTRKSFSPREAAQLIEVLAGAVQHAHDRGVVHRDLKPSNILVAGDGTFKLTDFSLARMLDDSLGHTLTGLVLGTPSYMSPEQARGKSREIGPAADVYGLGAVLYELLTGRPPFPSGGALDTVQRVLTEEPTPPRHLATGIPRDLETVCLKCLEKEARHRYPNARDLADDLHCFLDNRPLRSRPVGPFTRLARWCQRPERIRGAGSVGLGISLLLLVWCLATLAAMLAGLIRPEVPARCYTYAVVMLGGVYLPMIGIGCAVLAGKRAGVWAGAGFTLAFLVWIEVMIVLDWLGTFTYFDLVGLNINPNFRLFADLLIVLLLGVQLAAYLVALVACRAQAESNSC
jgi:hypothetical protein